MESAIAVDGTMDTHHGHATPNPLKCQPALTQMSPERINQQRIPQSPSLHSYLADQERPRTRDSFTSDVQSKVAFLNGLANASGQSSPTRPRRIVAAPTELGASPIKQDANTSSGAFQRAIMGYEEAQASLATVTAELERSKEEMATRKKRERMLAQRVEDLLEELQAEKEKRARDQESYTKEVKRCRKETYRAELAVVEARQDLQDTRAELKKSQAEVQHERSEKEKSRQESFERAYALAGTVGELDQAKDKLKAVEKERDAALLEANTGIAATNAMVEKAIQTELVDFKTEPIVEESSEIIIKQEQDDSVRAIRAAIKSQWSHHVQNHANTRPASATSTASGARITSERRPRLRAPKVPDLASVLSRLNQFSDQTEGQPTTSAQEIVFLRQELAWAKRKHAEDADLIHLMHMQCQFKACPCRLAESNGENFVHDQEYEAKLQQQHASKKRKVSDAASEQDTAQPSGGSLLESQPSIKAGETSGPQQHAPRQVPPAYLPPDPVSTRISEEPLVLEQALEVPLPEPEPMELDSSNSTPEPTAQLEEITQVLVEPAAGSKTFAFSTSVSSMADVRAVAPPLRHTETAPPDLDSELFDLSPPKQLPPRRPSTVMGILTMDSPIRLVPESPRSVRGPRDSASLRGRTHPTAAKSTTTTTTKIALKDTPSRNTLHRRAQSRPNMRSHSPLVTAAVMSHSSQDADQSNSAFSKEPSASPAASTVFPMTPVHKHSRSMHNLAHHAQVQAQSQQYHRAEHDLRSPPQTIATTTTTTRVPLRNEDADDVFSPEHVRHSRVHLPDHAQTEVLNIRVDTANIPVSDSQASSTILANVPGTPISREAALAQIRARRDRARSMNLKRSVEGGGKSPTKATRPMVVNAGKENLGMRSIREISHASAPGRFGS
jgi:hypothetical protein